MYGGLTFDECMLLAGQESVPGKTKEDLDKEGGDEAADALSKLSVGEGPQADGAKKE